MDTFAETAIVDTSYRLPTKENNFRFPFLFSANKQKFAVYIFHLLQTN
jgi:hypothetical protein